MKAKTRKAITMDGTHLDLCPACYQRARAASKLKLRPAPGRPRKPQVPPTP